MFFCCCASKGQDSPKASPRVIFKWKSFIEQLKLLLKWMLIERWRRQGMFNVPTCAGVDTNMWALLGSQGANPDSVSSKWPGCLFAPRMSRTTFDVWWHRILKSVMLTQGGGGVPSPRVQASCNSGWPDSDKFYGSIACTYSTSLCPYSQKTEEQ